MKRTLWFLLIGFAGMQVYDLFKYLNIEYTVPLRGVRFNGTRYDITLPLETMVWFFSVFVFLCLNVWRYYELHGKPRELLIAFGLFVLLTVDMLLIMNKPFGWYGHVPVCTDLVIGAGLIWLLARSYWK